MDEVTTPPTGGWTILNKSFEKHLKNLQQKHGILPIEKMSSDKYVQPQKRAKTSENITESQQTSNVINISTNNRFGLLTEQDLEEMDTLNTTDGSQQLTNKQNPVTETKQKTYKPPPIILTSKIVDYPKFHQSIKESIGAEKFRVQYGTNETRIYTTDMESHTKLRISLTETNASFFTHTPKNDKPYKLVLKTGPVLESEKLKVAFETLNIPIKQCTKLVSKKTGNGHSYLISTDKNKVGDMKNIKEIDCVQLNWENYARKDMVSQCYRCQAYGHGSSNCNQKIKCLKCGENHYARDCSIQGRNEETRKKLICANCGGPHPANYKQCPTYLDYISKKQISTKTNVPQTELPNHSNYSQFPPLRNNNMHNTYHTNTNNSNNTFNNNMQHTNAPFTYSQVTQNKTPVNNLFPTLLQEINELNDICNLNDMINMIKELKFRLRQCSNPLEKIQIISEIAAKYNI